MNQEDFSNHVKLKTSMIQSNLSDYSYAYLNVLRNYNNYWSRSRWWCGVILKNCTPLTEWISEINITQIDNAKDIHVVMPMYNLIEYSTVSLDNCSKTSQPLWQYHRYEPANTTHNSIKD